MFHLYFPCHTSSRVTRQYPALNGPGQCLLKFASSLAIFAVSVHGLLVRLSSCCPCPANASMFHRRASHKCPCEILFPTTWRVKDVMVQNDQVEQMEKQLVCALLSLTDDWVTLSHSVTPPHVLFILCHIFCFYCNVLLITETAFFWQIVNIDM
jgi:hypothetical protein